MKSKLIPDVVLEEALDALTMRVRWYWSRGHKKAIPEGLRLAFNYLCDALEKPNSMPYERLRR